MNTKQIDCVLELARTLNFKEAAAHLFMSQSSMSYQIQALEKEVGFQIFDRTGHGTSMTGAGLQFVSSLTTIKGDLRRAVEMGQNFNARFRESIRVGLTWRSSLLALPQAMRRMQGLHPDLDITPVFNQGESLEDFLAGEQDIVFLRDDGNRPAHATIHPLYQSRIYLVTTHDHPLAQRPLVHMEDLAGETLMVGGTSPGPLRAVQHRVVTTLGIDHFNSNDHETTLINVAAGKGVCLSPGLYNDGSDAFAWTPFDCEETISCVLLTHDFDERPEVAELIALLQDAYRPGTAFGKLV